jgi:hypothetical protein
MPALSSPIIKTIFNVDRAQEIADLINENSQKKFPVDPHA